MHHQPTHHAIHHTIAPAAFQTWRAQGYHIHIIRQDGPTVHYTITAPTPPQTPRPQTPRPQRAPTLRTDRHNIPWRIDWRSRLRSLLIAARDTAAYIIALTAAAVALGFDPLFSALIATLAAYPISRIAYALANIQWPTPHARRHQQLHALFIAAATALAALTLIALVTLAVQ